jgi:hypothetical protein
MRNAGMKSLPCFTNGGFDSSFYILPPRQTMISREEQGFFDSLNLIVRRLKNSRNCRLRRVEVNEYDH